MVLVREGDLVDLGRRVLADVFEVDAEIDLPPLQGLEQVAPDVHFFFPVDGRDAGREIQLFAVERFYFDGYFFGGQLGRNLAEARHGLNHKPENFSRR